jgi:hypothetical protein
MTSPSVMARARGPRTGYWPRSLKSHRSTTKTQVPGLSRPPKPLRSHHRTTTPPRDPTRPLKSRNSTTSPNYLRKPPRSKPENEAKRKRTNPRRRSPPSPAALTPSHPHQPPLQRQPQPKPKTPPTKSHHDPHLTSPPPQHSTTTRSAHHPTRTTTAPPKQQIPKTSPNPNKTQPTASPTQASTPWPLPSPTRGASSASGPSHSCRRLRYHHPVNLMKPAAPPPVKPPHPHPPAQARPGRRQCPTAGHPPASPTWSSQSGSGQGTAWILMVRLSWSGSGSRQGQRLCWGCPPRLRPQPIGSRLGLGLRLGPRLALRRLHLRPVGQGPRLTRHSRSSFGVGWGFSLGPGCVLRGRLWTMRRRGGRGMR